MSEIRGQWSKTISIRFLLSRIFFEHSHSLSIELKAYTTEINGVECLWQLGWGSANGKCCSTQSPLRRLGWLSHRVHTAYKCMMNVRERKLCAAEVEAELRWGKKGTQNINYGVKMFERTGVLRPLFLFDPHRTWSFWVTWMPTASTSPNGTEKNCACEPFADTNGSLEMEWTRL